MNLLECYLLMQLLVDKIEVLSPEVNKYRLKQASNQWLKAAIPTVEVEYNKMFRIDEETTQSIAYEYELLARQIATLNIPDKIGLGKMINAWQYDPHAVEATTDRIIKRESRNGKN